MSDIDDLLIEAKRVCGERWQKAPEYPWEVAARFGAEVERLRAANDSYPAFALQNAGLVEELAESNAKVAKLEAEVGRLRTGKDEAIALMVKAQRKAGELEAENAELQRRLSITPKGELDDVCWLCSNETRSGFCGRRTCITKLAERMRELTLLRAENADYANRLDDWRLQAGEALRKVAKLEAENAELRGLVERLRLSEFRIARMSQGFETERDKLKAMLAWFERREPLIRQGLIDERESNGFDCCYPWSIVDDWEREHPCPGS